MKIKMVSNFPLQFLLNLNLNLYLYLFLKSNLLKFLRCSDFKWLLDKFKNQFYSLVILISLKLKYPKFWPKLMNFQNQCCSFIDECNSILHQVEFSQVYIKFRWLFTFNERRLYVHHQVRVLFKIKEGSFDKELVVRLSRFQVFKAISKYWLHQVLYSNVFHQCHKAFTFSKQMIWLFKAFFSLVINI